ncbi:uncharacterized protein LOC129975570 [Argiope bruennichi]|uniref:uncharacterized protein LOC129975570 n=1 Tax=Argiope bruennichi TaxID=94029 RepID=UPI0024941510|nr:uncharacterized protein LOC129975570 [Argiope bruennichi]
MCELTRDKRQAVILMHQENISNVKIAHRCDCNESTVFSLIKRFKTEGNVDKTPRGGHPRLSYKCTDVTFTRLRRKNRFASYATLAREWNESTSVIASPRTFRRRLYKADYKAQVPRKNPILTKAMWGKKDWSGPRYTKIGVFRNGDKLCSATKSLFFLMSDKPGHVWRKTKEIMRPECLVHTSKHPESVMVWGCMSYQSTERLYFVQKSMNGDKYVDVLKDQLLCRARAQGRNGYFGKI